MASLNLKNGPPFKAKNLCPAGKFSFLEAQFIICIYFLDAHILNVSPYGILGVDNGLTNVKIILKVKEIGPENSIEAGAQSSVEASAGRRILQGATAIALAAAAFAGMEGSASAQQQERSPMLMGLNAVHYADPAMREYVREGNADAVVVWAPDWKNLEPRRGKIDKSQWTNYDESVRNARTDGARIFVAVSSETPRWETKPGHTPRNITTRGRWAKYLRLVARRHQRGIDAFITMNEPNLTYRKDKRLARRTAKMIRTSDIAFRQAGYRGRLLFPAASDSDKPDSLKFTRGVLRHLKDWRPRRGRHLISWSVHSYKDVKEGTYKRAGKVLEYLSKPTKKFKWIGDKRLWITEGGYPFDTKETKNEGEYRIKGPQKPQEDEQKQHMSRHINWSRNIGRVAMWTNYGYRDQVVGGGGFMSGLVRPDGTLRPIHEVWSRLK